MLNAIFLDFDGVILESAGIKAKAFRKLFGSYDHFEEIIEYLDANPGVSRYDKFGHIYKHILKRELSEEEKDKLSSDFSGLVLEEIKVCPFVPGTKKFLEKYSEKLKLYVASATPTEELKYIIKEKGIADFFSGVYGAPDKKSDIIYRVIQKENIPADSVLFVGDAISDFQHAKKAGVGFIGRITGNNNPFPSDVRVVSDLEGLDRFVECIL